MPPLRSVDGEGISLVTSKATITISNGVDSVIVSGPGWDVAADGISLDTDPKGLYSTGFVVRTQSGVNEFGGRITGQSVPVREMTLPFDLFETVSGPVSETKWRFHRLFGSPPNLNRVTWSYDLDEQRKLVGRLSKEIDFTTEDGFDETIDGDHVHAVVSLIVPQPNYEGPEKRATWTKASSGLETGYFAVWNPTDQPLWLEWVIDPCTSCSFPDFSYGQERKFNRPTNADVARMIITPALVSKLSVMVDPMMRTYVTADGSNITPLFNGVEPVYQVPPYTGSKGSPVVYPVTMDAPAGRRVTLVQRRFWSAESGLYR